MVGSWDSDRDGEGGREEASGAVSLCCQKLFVAPARSLGRSLTIRSLAVVEGVCAPAIPCILWLSRCSLGLAVRVVRGKSLAFV